MFRDDSEVIPRTYHVKSYTARKSFSVKKMMAYLAGGVSLVLILGLVVLTAAGLL